MLSKECFAFSRILKAVQKFIIYFLLKYVPLFKIKRMKYFEVRLVKNEIIHQINIDFFQFKIINRIKQFLKVFLLK